MFLSVEWSSGHYPDKLVAAMRNFSTVFSAWDGDKLVGMVCAMDDGVMNAYLHYRTITIPEDNPYCLRPGTEILRVVRVQEGRE